MGYPANEVGEDKKMQIAPTANIIEIFGECLCNVGFGTWNPKTGETTFGLSYSCPLHRDTKNQEELMKLPNQTHSS